MLKGDGTDDAREMTLLDKEKSRFFNSVGGRESVLIKGVS